MKRFVGIVGLLLLCGGGSVDGQSTSTPASPGAPAADPAASVPAAEAVADPAPGVALLGRPKALAAEGEAAWGAPAAQRLRQVPAAVSPRRPSSGQCRLTARPWPAGAPDRGRWRGLSCPLGRAA